VFRISRATIVAGRYRIISPLGAGGMGEAFRAWDQEAGCPVVLKRPLAVYASRTDVLERFDREINRLLELPHGNIVPILGHGHDEFGVPFLAMRFLPGGSLADRSKPQPATRLHSWLPGVAAALDFAHACGVLHRDVKPGNIFFDAKGVAYLGDFGIAKVIEDELQPQGEEALTGTGENLGTSAYMAPEFYRQPRILTGAYDQYALGITVYEMVCGRRPFSGDGGQLILAHATQAPPDVRTIHPKASPSFCEAVARALAKKPERRFASCTAFAEAALQEIRASVKDETTFRFMCPSCRKLVKVPEQFGGRDGRCTQCGVRLRVSDNLDALWLYDEADVAAATPARKRGDRTTVTPVSRTGSTQPGGHHDRTAWTAIAQTTLTFLSRRTHLRGIVVALSILVLAIVGVGLWMRSSARVASLAQAIAQSRWDDALAIEPYNVAALVGRARNKLRALPPDLAGAFTDLDWAGSGGRSSPDIEAARGDAHAMRASDGAIDDRLDVAAKDLAEAKRLGGSVEFLAVAQEAFVTGWVRRALTASETGDASALQRAAAAAQAAGAANERLAQVWETYARGRITACDVPGLKLACDESAKLGLSGETRAGWWLELANHAARPPHENAVVVRTALDAAKAGADEDAVLATFTVFQPAVFAALPPLQNSIGIELKLIPPGRFSMGQADGEADEAPHQVTLTKAFYLGVTEVTNAQWSTVMGRVPSEWQDADRPVEQVSWHDAVEFCRKLSALPAEREAGRVYRLPTEAEWEYACRAGSTTQWSFGDDESRLGEYAWYDKNSGHETHPVGKKKANVWGLFDMHGNVCEWCSDWGEEYPKGAVTDPQGPSGASVRVYRGGNWRIMAGLCRSACRGWDDPSFRPDYLGFRLALSPSGASLPEAEK